MVQSTDGNPPRVELRVEEAPRSENLLIRAGQSEGGAGGHYSPRWYSGRSHRGGFGDLASSLGGGGSGGGGGGGW